MDRQCAGADGVRCPWGSRARRGDRLCVGCQAIIGQARARGARLRAVVARGQPVSVPAAVEAIDARTPGPGPLPLWVEGAAGVRVVHRALRERIATLEGRNRDLVADIAAADARAGGAPGDDGALRQAARRAQMALNAADLAELRTIDASTGLLPWE